MAFEFMTAAVGGFKKEEGVEPRKTAQAPQMFSQVGVVKHDVEHPQTAPFFKVVLRVALNEKDIPGTDTVTFAVDPVCTVTGSDDDELRKIVRMADVGQVAFVLDVLIPLNGPQCHGAPILREEIRTVGDDGFHNAPSNRKIVLSIHNIIKVF